MLIYLGLAALASFVAALVLLLLGQASLPAITHLLLAAGIMPLIFGAITHFIPVLTRSSAAPRSLLLAPILLQLAGVVSVLGVLGEAPPPALTTAASGTLLLAAALAAWMNQRARRALGTPHPCWHWYLAAVSMLGVGLLLVAAMAPWPQARNTLRLLHLHLNVLGFVGLTALGTLQVLLPTVLNTADPTVSQRLRRHLPVAVGAVLLIAIGAALSLPLALTGALLLSVVVLTLGRAILTCHGWRRLLGDGAAAPLAGALAGFLLLLALGAGHAVGTLDGRDSTLAFIVGFLLPLVTGALTHLLPVWLLRGKRTARRDRLHTALRHGGTQRASLFLTAGALLGLDISAGLWPALLALLHFLGVALRALCTDRE
ncbi:hypothetical protein [Accumulibacter sp.]|uniref:hypothetical protein n=1 Tax=Accumulibacter sp. TaxID=2053492 RepID=UPI0025F18B6D|nr:hypothetical protein [Accumulibacter sp.]MCM8613239.1 hypothetical protein [Accumulibacter sp.]MCM8636903.1 hypothetical protein [Accumulibacter sp.]MCM8638891.1 hypothetical protein [Accumulibacter sp.]